MNSQVLVKGIETTGCVLVAAGSSRILNRLHKPVWSKGELLNKKTWVGKMENMQVHMLFLPIVSISQLNEGGTV